MKSISMLFSALSYKYETDSNFYLPQDNVSPINRQETYPTVDL